jgi:hypothetical protein
MAIDITREELRADIYEITTEVVNRAVSEATHNITRMVTEDLVATNERIDNLDHGLTGLTKRLDDIDDKLGQTNQLLRHHISDPLAHRR